VPEHDAVALEETTLSFKAYLINQEDTKIVSRFVDMDDTQLDPGEVTIAVTHSSVNYKDALAATGAGRIIRRYPCIGGIDMAGTWRAARTPVSRRATRSSPPATTSAWHITAAMPSMAACRPTGWCPAKGMSLARFDGAGHGRLHRRAGCRAHGGERPGKPANGKVIVSGATGGVGSIAIDILARLGYEVVALTGKESQADYLKGLGAKEVMLRASLDLAKIKPLDKALWAGAVDNLGGEVLAWMASTMQQGGTIASIGLAASMSLNTSVAPFILRGASLLGIDSGYIGEPVSERRLAASGD
jgi:acrylyl-CoA reductase (NADPH)